MGHDTIGVHFYVLCEELGPNLNPLTTRPPFPPPPPSSLFNEEEIHHFPRHFSPIASN